MRTTALTSKRKMWTDKELEALPSDGHNYELLAGVLIDNPGNANHSEISVRLGSALLHFVDARKLGNVFGANTGFRLAEDLLLCPDVSFLSKERLKKIGLAPDLMVEVFSQSDRWRQVNRKLDHYFEHGTKLAWLVNWRKEQVHIYTDDSIESLTNLDDVLTGGLVLPGFKCKLRKIFHPG